VILVFKKFTIVKSSSDFIRKDVNYGNI